MPKGFGFVNRAAQETAARGGSSWWAGKLIFKLADGEAAEARFVELDGDFVHSAWHHEVPVEGRAWGDMVPCIAQDEDGDHTEDDCPGCDADLPLKFKGYIGLIWRDAPIYKKDEKGKIVKDNLGDLVVTGHEDQIAVWSSGPRLFENLGEIHEAYNGIGSRDFKVKRKGVKTDTTYTIVPADIDGGKKALSAADKKLVKETEVDLAEVVRAPSFEDWEARLSGKPPASSNGSSGDSEPAKTAAGSNPFKRKKSE